MGSEKEKSRNQNQGSGLQPPIGQQDQDRREYDQQNEPASGSEPPRSLGTRGEEFGHPPERGEQGQQGQSGTGQADLGTQSDTTLAGRSDQQDLGQDQPGSFAGGISGRQAEDQGEGFVGSQSPDSSEYLQQSGTPDSGFGEQGQGAPDQDDVERGMKRSQNRDSDIEGSSGNS
jgi:hypothetical protein